MSSTNGYVTKDSGERQTFSTGMVRDSGAKDLRPDLIWLPMLRRLYEVGDEMNQGVGLLDRGDARNAFLDWFEDVETGIDTAAALLAAIADVENDHPRPLPVRWAELMGRGAKKYGERNWEKAATPEELERFKASAFRHFFQWVYEIDTEEDHAAAVCFNVAGAEYVKEKLDEATTYEVQATLFFDGKAVPFFTSIGFSTSAEPDEEPPAKVEAISSGEYDVTLEDGALKKLIDSILAPVGVPPQLEAKLDVAELEAVAKVWQPNQGDRVRIKPGILHAGRAGTLKKSLGGKSWSVKFENGGLLAYGEHELEPLPEAWQPKIGDRVRINAPAMRYHGQEAKITERAHGAYQWRVRFEDGNWCPLLASEIERIESGAV